MAVYGTYQINFNANHGSGAPSAVSGTTVSTIMVDMQNYYTATVTLPSSKPSRNYYTFLGWSSSPTASSASYSAGGTFNVGTTSSSYVTTLYAVWRRQTAYVYYNANGGTGAPATQSHNAGTTVTLSATVPTRSGYRFLGWATSASATSAQYQPSTTQSFYTTITLYAVWKIMVSTITASNGTMGAAQTITITKQDSAYKDTVTYSFGSQSGTIASNSTATSISWTPPLSLASEIPNAKSATCTLTTKTYNGTTLLGSSSKTITLTIPNTMTPSASVTLTDTNAVASSMGVYVQSRSALEVTVSASGQYGATITGYSTQINSNAYSTATFTTGALIASGTNSYTTVVTDSRGMQTTVTGTFTVVSYTAPTAQVPSITRDETNSSNVNVALDYIVASVNNLNAKTYTVEYKLRSASTYQTYSSGTLPDYNGTLNLVLTGFSGDNDFDFIFTVADSFSSEFGAGTFEASIGSDNSLLIHSQHKAGLGFGMPSQGEKRNDYRYPVYMRQGSAVYSLSGSGYIKALTFGTDVTTGKNLAPVNSWSTGRRWWGSNVNSTGLLGQVLESLPVGTYTISWKHTLTAIPADTSTTLQVGKYVRVYYGGAYHVLSSYSLTTIPAYAVGDTYSVQATITIGAEAVGQSFEVLAYCGQDNAFYATLEEYQIEVGATATPFEPYVNMNDLAVSEPLTLEYIRSDDTEKTEITVVFNPDYSLNSFKSSSSPSAYLQRSASSAWDLYIETTGGASILDMHIPWADSDMTLEWVGTVVSVLPTGAVEATEIPTNLVTTYGDLSHTGQTAYNNGSEITLSASTYKTVAQFTLSAGKWVISGCVRFGMNNTGRRRCFLSTSKDGSSDVAYLLQDEIKGWSDGSGHANAQFCSVLSVPASTTYYLNAWQNSGSNLSALGRLMAIRIC